MTFLPVPLRAKTTTYNFCSPCPYSHPRIQDLHLHSCHLVTLSSAGTPFPPPPSHSFPCHPNKTHTQKGSPRHTMFLCTPFARHCRPRPPAALSPSGPLCRETRGPRWLPAFSSSPQAPQARLAHLDRQTRQKATPGCEQRPRRAGRPGLWPAALCLQPGRTAPTLRRRRRPRDTALPRPEPGPAPPFGTPFTPSPCLLPSPLRPIASLQRRKRVHQMHPYSAAAGPPRRVLPLRVAAEAPLSLPGPQACSPAPSLLLNRSLSIKPGAKHRNSSF